MSEQKIDGRRNYFRLTAEQARFLNLDTYANERQVQKRINLLYTIYTNDRFAPADTEEELPHLNVICVELGMEPEAIVRGDARYCGNYYLLPNATMGTAAECQRKGRYWGDVHGKLAT